MVVESQQPPRLDVLKALGDNTRYAIYLELVRSPRALTTADVAESLGLHPNTVRPHLDRMREVGLVDVDVDSRGALGRPQHRFSVASSAPSLGLEPPVMPVLAAMVVRMAERAGATSEDAHEAGRAEGLARAGAYSTAPSTLEALVSEQERWGFDPIVGDGADDDAVVGFANCPFRVLAESHPQLLCSLHHGLVAGFVEGMGDSEVREFCPLVHRTPCQVTLGPALSAPAPAPGTGAARQDGKMQESDSVTIIGHDTDRPARRTT